MSLNVNKKLRGSSIYALHFIQAGFLYTSFHNLAYPLFGRYFNLASHQYSSLRSLYSLAWGCKIFFSFCSDSLPVFGYRRLPYLVTALSAISIILLILSLKPIPEPYYAIESGDNCTQKLSDPPQNPEAPNEATSYVLLFFLWYWALACSDSTIDALITQRSKLEPDEKRGTLISCARISRQLGSMFAYLAVGILFNTVNYGGSFCGFDFKFNHFTWILFVFTIVGLIYALMFTNEKDIDKEKEKIEVKRKLAELWSLFHKWYYLKLLIFAVYISLISSIRSPAILKIQIHWAQVNPITIGFVHVVGGLIASGGMIIYLKFFLASNWRKILAVVTIFEVFTELPVVTMTIFDVIRNQYFWFVDDLVYSLTRFWFDYVMELVIVEYAPNGIEGISYALVWAFYTIGQSTGSAISNFIMSPFCLTSDERYLRDSSEDKLASWISYLLSVLVHLSTLIVLFLVPKQKTQALEWKEKSLKVETRNSWNALIFVCLCVCGLIGSSALNLMTMFESTRCLMIAGGPGCASNDQFDENSNCILY